MNEELLSKVDFSEKKVIGMPTSREYLEIVTEEGYRPKLNESETSLTFKHEGNLYWLGCPPDDDTFVKIDVSYSFPKGTELFKLLEAANEINEGIKAVKITVDYSTGGVLFSVEAFYEKASDLHPHLARIINILDYGSDKFFECLKGKEVSR